MTELELLLVTQARKANPDLHRRTDGEILQMFKENEMPDGQTDDSVESQGIMRFKPDNTSADAEMFPKYRIRDQLRKDFSMNGIPKDFLDGLGETYSRLRESPVGRGIGSLRNFATDMKDKGIDLGKMAISGIGNAIMPGLGFVLSSLPRDNPINSFKRSFTVGGSNMPVDPYGYYDALRAGNLNQDPFGRNPVSAFGNYKGTLAKDANYMGTNKFNLAKKDFAERFFDKNAQNAGGVKIDDKVYSGADYQGDTGGGGYGGGFDASTGNYNVPYSDDTE